MVYFYKMVGWLDKEQHTDKYMWSGSIETDIIESNDEYQYVIEKIIEHIKKYNSGDNSNFKIYYPFFEQLNRL